MRFFALTRGVAALALAASLAAPALAEPLAAPTEEVVLAVTGQVANGNAAEGANLDLALMATLGPAEITTSTIWTEGVHTFTGVPLDQFVKALGLTGTTLKMTAINDYMVEVPMADAIAGGPILAYEMDGKPMSVRDKGPVWLIYPFDSNTEYQSEVYYSRSIWQLNRIEAVN